MLLYFLCVRSSDQYGKLSSGCWACNANKTLGYHPMLLNGWSRAAVGSFMMLLYPDRTCCRSAHLFIDVELP